MEKTDKVLSSEGYKKFSNAVHEITDKFGEIEENYFNKYIEKCSPTTLIGMILGAHFTRIGMLADSNTDSMREGIKADYRLYVGSIILTAVNTLAEDNKLGIMCIKAT